MNKGLNKRLFDFAISTLKFLSSLSSLPETKILRYQLAKSATSSGVNYEEAQSAVSKADFKNKICISLKEARETNYWLRIIKEMKYGNKVEIDYLLKESLELQKILGSICSKIK